MMSKVVTETNEEELEELIYKYNFLADELKKTANEIRNFQLKVVTMSLSEL